MKTQKVISGVLISAAYSFLLLALAAFSSKAQQIISYQGLVANIGNPIEGGHTVTVSIYADSFGGVAIYRESQSGVVFADGLFNVLIGYDKTSPLPKFEVRNNSVPLQLSRNYFLGISIDGGAELAPRSKLCATPAPWNSHIIDSARAAAVAAFPEIGDGVTSAVVNGKIYVIGNTGFNGSDIHIYDPDANRWSAGAPLPVAQSAMPSAVVDGKIYVLGGWSGSKDNTQIYDPATNTWSAGAPLPMGQQEAASAVVNGKIYVFGGHDPNTNQIYNQIYDPVANTWSTGVVIPAGQSSTDAGAGGSGEGIASAVVNGKIYVIGGFSGRQNDNQIYDPVANTWSTGAPLPVGESNATTAVMNGKIYVFGGFGDDDSKHNQIYDPVANTWSTGAALPDAQSGMTSAVVNGKIYLIGGFDNRNDVFDPVTNSWSVLVKNMWDSICMAASASDFLAPHREAKGQWKLSSGFSKWTLGFPGSGNYLLAIEGDSLFRSTDDGLTWSGFALNGALPMLATGNPATPVLLGSADGDTDFVNGDRKFSMGRRRLLSYSTNLGQTWIADTIGWSLNGLPMSIISVGGTIFMGTATGLFQQDAPGAPWEPVHGMAGGRGFGFFPVTSLVASGDTIFAAMGMMGGVFVSSDKGASWARANSGLPTISYEGWGTGQSPAVGFTLSGSSLFALIGHDSTSVTYDIYRTTSNGQNWTRMNSTPLNLGAYPPGSQVMTSRVQNLFVESPSGGVFASTDTGKTWFQANEGLPVEPDSMVIHGDTTSVVSSNGIRFSGIQISGGNLMVGCGEGILARKLSDFEKD